LYTTTRFFLTVVLSLVSDFKMAKKFQPVLVGIVELIGQYKECCRLVFVFFQTIALAPHEEMFTEVLKVARAIENMYISRSGDTMTIQAVKEVQDRVSKSMNKATFKTRLFSAGCSHRKN
jgi:hypothetical protein